MRIAINERGTKREREKEREREREREKERERDYFAGDIASNVLNATHSFQERATSVEFTAPVSQNPQ